MQVLLAHGAAEDARDKNWQTPAHVAAANDAVACMRLLIPAMSNVNITDRMGRTCLHLAAYFAHHKVSILISDAFLVYALKVVVIEVKMCFCL